MQTRTLGSTGPTVSALGLGCMGMSDLYGPADDAESVATIRAALDAGVTLLDTGDFYGAGHNELLIREALRGRDREQVAISVKFGALRGPDGGWLGVDARPAAVKNALAYTLRRLGTDHVDVYRPARLDPTVPIEETVGAIAEMVQAGYVRHIGLSEVGADTIRRAHAVHPVADLQIEYSLVSRGIEEEILPVARELGIGITAYGVLSRGLLSGHWAPDRADRGHRLPDPQPPLPGREPPAEPAARGGLAGCGGEPGRDRRPGGHRLGALPREDIVPLVGARRRDRLGEALGALDLALSEQDLAAIEQAVPASAVAGTRYAADQMAMLDSERPSAGEVTARAAPHAAAYP